MPDIIKIKDVLKQLTPEPPKDDVLSFEDFTRTFCQELSQPRKSEKRATERVELPPVPAEVQPLNDDLLPDGSPFAAIVRSISAQGIGLMFGKPVTCKFLQVRVATPSGSPLKTIIEVKHCTENGIMIGGSSLTEFQL